VSGGLSDEYLEIYENAAKEIAKIMNEKNIKEYVIYNGERVRFSNNAWVSCEYIPKDGEEVFKKTLIDCLD
jgi:L-rhamnose mutarotase